MGCNNIKKLLEDEENIKFLKVLLCEFGGWFDKLNNIMWKYVEKKLKKGWVVEGRFSFDFIVIDNYDIKVLIGKGLFSCVVWVEYKVIK